MEAALSREESAERRTNAMPAAPTAVDVNLDHCIEPTTVSVGVDELKRPQSGVAHNDTPDVQQAVYHPEQRDSTNIQQDWFFAQPFRCSSPVSCRGIQRLEPIERALIVLWEDVVNAGCGLAGGGGDPSPTAEGPPG